MTVAIGMPARCEGCVAYHTKMARGHGTTRTEVLETSRLPYTWAAGQGLFLAAMLCVPTISSPDN